MKNLFTLFLLCCFTSVSAQKDLRLNLISSLDYSILDKTQGDSLFNLRYKDQKNVGYSFELSLESVYERHAISIGLAYTKKRFYPTFNYVFYYGGQFRYGGDTIYVESPYMSLLEFQTISVPIIHKNYFRKGKRLSFYTMTGVAVDFSFYKKEIYGNLSYWQPEEPFEEKITATSRTFGLFGTAIKVGGGLSYQLSKGWALLLQSNIQVFEFRKRNQMLVDIWPNDNITNSFGWENQFFKLGQISLGIGLQKTFVN